MIIAASFATLAHRKVMADADVDAANLHLLLHPEVREAHDFSGGKTAEVNLDLCTGCGECLGVCRFDAIREIGQGVAIDPLSCEGCAVCAYICPAGAIQMEEDISGQWFISSTEYGPFVHARLGIGKENSGKLVTQVRREAKDIADREGLDYVIIDGPPGIGCPVIASLSGTDLALVVTEPTLSGIHDMERVVAMARHFRTQTACCINKHDLNPDNSAWIESWCEENEVPLLGKIPFDSGVMESLVRGVPLTVYSANAATEEVRTIWQSLERRLIPSLQSW